MSFASGDTNLYRYVGNNPGNAFDPSGLVAQGLDSQSFARALGNSASASRTNEVNATAMQLRFDDISERRMYAEFRQQREIAKQTHPFDMASLFLEEARQKLKRDYLERNTPDTTTWLGAATAPFAYAGNTFVMSVNDLLFGKIAASGSIGAPSLVAHSAEIATLMPVWDWLADPGNPDKMEGGLGLLGSVMLLGSYAKSPTRFHNTMSAIHSITTDPVNCIKTIRTKPSASNAWTTPRMRWQRPPAELPSARSLPARRERIYGVYNGEDTQGRVKLSKQWVTPFMDESKYPLLNQNDLGLKKPDGTPFKGKEACHPTSSVMWLKTHGVDADIADMIKVMDTQDSGFNKFGARVKGGTTDENKMLIVGIAEENGLAVEFHDFMDDVRGESMNEGRLKAYDKLREAVVGPNGQKDPGSQKSALVRQGTLGSHQGEFQHTVVVDGIREELNPTTGLMEDRIYYRDPQGGYYSRQEQRLAVWKSDWLDPHSAETYIGWAVVIKSHPLQAGSPAYSIFDTLSNVDETSLQQLAQTATSYWSESLGISLSQQFEIQVGDLQQGELAHVELGSLLDDHPSIRILVDRDANGGQWFVDSTPRGHEEFRAISQNAMLGTRKASRSYDLLTVLIHEIGHAIGFSLTNESFSRHVDRLDDGSFVFTTSNNRYRLDATGSELDPVFHPYSVMAATLPPGVRVLPGPNDIDILRTVITSQVNREVNTSGLSWEEIRSILSNNDRSASVPGSNPRLSDGRVQGKFIPLAEAVAADLANPLRTGIGNARFTQTNPNQSDFSWHTHGHVNFQENTATIVESTSMVSDLSQTFVIAPGIQKLSFTLSGIQLHVGNALSPSDAFEVALLNANQTVSRLAPLNSPAGTDALLSIQADGRIFVAPGVSVQGHIHSGDIHSLVDPILVTIDLASISG